MLARTSLKYISPLDSGNDVCAVVTYGDTHTSRALALINAVAIVARYTVVTRWENVSCI